MGPAWKKIESNLACIKQSAPSYRCKPTFSDQGKRILVPVKQHTEVQRKIVVQVSAYKLLLKSKRRPESPLTVIIKVLLIDTY